MKKTKVTIKGISPLLMNRFPLEPIKGFAKLSKEEQAEHKAYRIPGSKKLYVPGVAVQRMLVGAGLFSKGKGRASLMKTVAACVMIEPEYCELGTEEYIIDSRSAVNPSTKGRIVVHRPRIENWKISFDLIYDEVLLSAEQIRQVVDDAGCRVGLLDFRPANKGWFGKFMVISWN